MDADGRVTGVITNRDIGIASSMRYRPASEIAVREIVGGTVVTASPEEDVHDVLRRTAGASSG